MADGPPSGVFPIIEAAKRGNEDQIQELLRLRHPVNKKDSLNNTPMHWASAGGHAESVKILVSHKGDVNAINKNGDAPLHKAAWKNHQSVVYYLLSQGADRDIVNVDGKKPLDLCRSDEVRKLLVPPIEYSKPAPSFCDPFHGS
jgi:ankyrin repeat protein